MSKRRKRRPGGLTSADTPGPASAPGSLIAAPAAAAAAVADSRQAFLLRQYGVVLDGRRYRVCRGADCCRVVPDGAGFCCGPCEQAAQHMHELDEHTPGCDERWRERRPLVAEALADGSW